MIHKKFRSFTYMMLIALAMIYCAKPAVAKVLAKGEGFEITTDDVENQKAFFKENGFESTDAEHLNAVLKMRLFALEAKANGLIQSLPEPSGPYKYEMVQRYNQIYQSYVIDLLSKYPVSDDAILSYYQSYPEKFRVGKENGSEKGDPAESEMKLDAGLKRWIRDQIVESKKVVIIQDEFERLKAKYHVEIEK